MPMKRACGSELGKATEFTRRCQRTRNQSVLRFHVRGVYQPAARWEIFECRT